MRLGHCMVLALAASLCSAVAFGAESVCTPATTSSPAPELPRKYTPDPSPWQLDQTTVLRSHLQGFDNNVAPNPVIAAKGKPLVAVAASLDRKDPNTAIINRINLATGASLGCARLPVPRNMKLADLSIDASRVMFRAENRSSNDRLVIWTIDGGHSQPDLVLHPAPQQDLGPFQFAAFTAADRFLTTRASYISLHDLPTGKVVFIAARQRPLEPAISATGKYVALATSEKAFITEAATGQVALDLPSVLAQAYWMAFSPSGKQLVACNTTTIWAVDLTTGKLTHEFSLPATIPCRIISSPADGYALVAHSFLVDLDRRYPIWKYEDPRHGSMRVLPSGLLADTGLNSITAAVAPHSAAYMAAVEFGTPEALLKPGSNISVQDDLDLPTQQRKIIISHIRNDLMANGLNVVTDAPLRLILSIEAGQPRTAKVTSTSSPPTSSHAPATTALVTYTPKTSIIRIEFKGERVWEATRISTLPDVSPAMLSMLLGQQEVGRTLQQQADEKCRPDLGFFTSTSLPKYLPKPRTPVLLGRSILTPNGWEDQPDDTDATPRITPVSVELPRR